MFFPDDRDKPGDPRACEHTTDSLKTGPEARQAGLPD